MSSVTIVAGSATPHGIKVVVAIDAGGGSVDLSKTTLIAALAQGPLRAFLNSLTTNAAWAALLDDPRFFVSLYTNFIPAINLSPGEISMGISPLRFQFASSTEAVFTAQLRFLHSLIR